jgi:type VI secretion system protein ImpA
MINLQALLAPINPLAPSGEDLSFSTEFDAIQEARRFDDATLEQGAWITSLKESDWPQVRGLCIELLTNRSKDLRLAMWLTEALAKQAGFNGLAQGLRLTAQLCNDLWDSIHPQPEQGDHEQRIGNLTWLLTRTTQLVRELPVTDAPEMRYSTLDYDAALQLSRLIARNPADAANLSEGRLTLERIDKAQRATHKQFYEALLPSARDCQVALAELEAAVDARLGLEGPGFGPCKNAFENVLTLIESLAHDAGAHVAAQTSIHTTSAAQPAHTTASSEVQGSIESRTQALQRLTEVAAFFKRTEPHSPIAYLVDKAVRWGDMPLHAWLRTVVKDPASLAHLEEMLGVDTSSSGNS